MLWTEGLLRDLQGALRQRLGLGVLAQGAVNLGQIVETGGCDPMLCAKAFFSEPQRSFRYRESLSILALAIKVVYLLVELFDILRSLSKGSLQWEQEQ